MANFCVFSPAHSLTKFAPSSTYRMANNLVIWQVDWSQIFSHFMHYWQLKELHSIATYCTCTVLIAGVPFMYSTYLEKVEPDKYKSDEASPSALQTTNNLGCSLPYPRKISASCSCACFNGCKSSLLPCASASYNSTVTTRASSLSFNNASYIPPRACKESKATN